MGGSKHREETSIGTAMPLIDLTSPENALSDEAQERLTNLWPSRYVWEGIGLSPATNKSTINSQDDGSEPSAGGACRVRPHG